MSRSGRLPLMMLLLAGTVLGAAGPSVASHGALHRADAPADWPQYLFGANHSGFNAGETTINSANVASLELAWQAQLGITVDSTPAAADGAIFVTAGHRLYALDMTTGTTLWAVKGTSGMGSPSVGNGFVYVSSDDGTLYAFNETTGALLWMASPAGGSSAPAVTATGVYVLSTTTLSDFDPATGLLLWAVPAQAFGVVPSVADGEVFISSDDGHFYMFDATTGETLWTSHAEYKPGASPAALNGAAYVSAHDMLFAFATTGYRLWRATSDYHRLPLSVDDTRVYAVSLTHRPKTMSAFDAATGSQLWTTALGFDETPSPIAVANGVLYVGHGRYVTAYDAGSGTALWDHRFESYGRVIAPIVADGMVFAAAGTHVYAFGLP
jgi:outer membrane protein assembly factor BamB